MTNKSENHECDGTFDIRVQKVAYDFSRNLFWLVCVETRSGLQRIEEKPFGVASGNEYVNFGGLVNICTASIDADSGTLTYDGILRNDGDYDRTVRGLSRVKTDSEDVGGRRGYFSSRPCGKS